MFSAIYNAILFLIGIFALPKLLWLWLRHSKYRSSLAARLGFSLPLSRPSQKKHTIWIHAVSVGETRAVIPLYQKLRKEYPESEILVSSTTETGQAEALRSLSGASAYFFLPLDFSWTVKRLCKNIKPDLLILVESDFWYHLLKYAKEEGAKVILVNGKLSKRSFERFRLFSFFGKKLFPLIDHLCVQSALYQERFLQLGLPKEKISITGNLKLEIKSPKLAASELKKWKEELGITPEDRVVILGSTHDPEEEWLLDQLILTHSSLKILLVPRHPERFDQVAKKLQQKGIPFFRFSQRQAKKGDEKVILIDTMGFLLSCYQLGELAIVGGSFVKHVGGHNIFEPLLFDIPVIFGPHMHSQRDLATLILEKNAGYQVSLPEIAMAVSNLLQNTEKRAQLSHASQQILQEAQGSLNRTWELIENSLS